MKLRELLLGMMCLGLMAGCGGSNAKAGEKSFDVVLRAASDVGEPVEGVRFSNGHSVLGTTNAEGVVKTQIRGIDGQNMAVAANCPDGYLAPEQPTQLRLAEVRKLDPGAAANTEVDIVCVRKTRDVALVIRAANGPMLAVEVDGKSVGSTDANGFAHLGFQLERTVKSVSVSLGTSAAPKLRPQNPSRIFDIEDRDAVLLFDQNFAVERPAPVRRKVAVAKQTPTKHVPYRIDSGRNHAF